MAYNPRLQHGKQSAKNAATGGRENRRNTRDRNRRALSQNFLHDRASIQQIVRASRPERGPELVIEVGAGQGHLTAALAATGTRVVAYEIDPVVAFALRARCGELDNVRVVRGDFLASSPPREPFAVVGNIPYASTTKIVDWCLKARSMTSATLVTQLEYARKRTGDFGRWSQVTVESWPRFDWRLGARIGREKFRPVPSVDSAIVRLERRATASLPEGSLPEYRRLVMLGFSGVGGSLHASLRTRHRRALVDKALASAGVRHDTVVGYVHPDQWITTFRTIHGLAA